MYHNQYGQQGPPQNQYGQQGPPQNQYGQGPPQNQYGQGPPQGPPQGPSPQEREMMEAINIAKGFSQHYYSQFSANRKGLFDLYVSIITIYNSLSKC